VVKRLAVKCEMALQPFLNLH